MVGPPPGASPLLKVPRQHCGMIMLISSSLLVCQLLTNIEMLMISTPVEQSHLILQVCVNNVFIQDA